MDNRYGWATAAIIRCQGSDTLEDLYLNQFYLFDFYDTVELLCTGTEWTIYNKKIAPRLIDAGSQYVYDELIKNFTLGRFVAFQGTGWLTDRAHPCTLTCGEYWPGGGPYVPEIRCMGGTFIWTGSAIQASHVAPAFSSGNNNGFDGWIIC
jgi:hypothetical protein